MKEVLRIDTVAEHDALLFHPDLISGISLGKHLQDYTFFTYQTKEALHLSEAEREIVLGCFDRIRYELEQGADSHLTRFRMNWASGTLPTSPVYSSEKRG